MSDTSDAKIVREAIDKTVKGWKGPPKIDSWEFDVGEDQTGDPSVDVTVYLEESTRDEDWTSENLDPIADSIRQAVVERGVERFVYVHYLRPSDLKQNGAPE